MGSMQSDNFDRLFWRDSALDCVIHQHVGEPTYPTLSAAGMYAGKLFSTKGNYGYKFTLSSWRGSECSEGLTSFEA